LIIAPTDAKICKFPPQKTFPNGEGGAAGAVTKEVRHQAAISEKPVRKRIHLSLQNSAKRRCQIALAAPVFIIIRNISAMR
jgi:hypothetical protein